MEVQIYESRLQRALVFRVEFFICLCLFLSGLDRVTIQFMDSSIPGRNHDPQIIQFDKANSTLQKIGSQQP